MHRTGFANQPTSRSIDDGLELHGAWIGAAVRCAPPANKPTPQERANCRPWSEHEAALLPGLRVILCLGALAWDAALTLRGAPVPRPKPALRPRRAARRRRGPAAAGHVPPEPAEHVHRPPDPGDARRRAASRPGTGMGRGADGARTLDEMAPLDAFTPARPRLVRARVRGADRRAGAGLAGHRHRRAHADLRAHRLGQDARRVPLGPRPPGGRAAARRRGARASSTSRR